MVTISSYISCLHCHWKHASMPMFAFSSTMPHTYVDFYFETASVSSVYLLNHVLGELWRCLVSLFKLWTVHFCSSSSSFKFCLSSVGTKEEHRDTKTC